MSNDRIWILLGKQLSGEISSAELSELEALLKEDPEAAASRELAATNKAHFPNDPILHEI